MKLKVTYAIVLTIGKEGVQEEKSGAISFGRRALSPTSSNMARHFADFLSQLVWPKESMSDNPFSKHVRLA
jgi:hypothetical protein